MKSDRVLVREACAALQEARAALDAESAERARMVPDVGESIAADLLRNPHYIGFYIEAVKANRHRAQSQHAYAVLARAVLQCLGDAPAPLRDFAEDVFAGRMQPRRPPGKKPLGSGEQRCTERAVEILREREGLGLTKAREMVEKAIGRKSGALKKRRHRGTNR